MTKILITGGNGNLATLIKNNLSKVYEIISITRKEVNILNFDEIKNYLANKSFDILIHTAIKGGRRTIEENGDITHTNLQMWENILYFANHFKMIINFDSAAIYDRNTDIFNRKEEDVLTVPSDFYGFSKYNVYQRSLYYNHVYNFRVFNIFHIREEKDRFIHKCFLSKKEGKEITIFQDKYFDFVYEEDFIKILKFYLDNYLNSDALQKTINICYDQKYKLSDIARLIIEDESKVIIENSDLLFNYSGNADKLMKLGIELNGLDKSLTIYKDNFFKEENQLK